jgi:flagellar hook-associated protein 2
MSNVGISFGSPTSGQGFDVSSTVSQMVSNLQAVETPWKNQLTALQAQDTALTGIGTDLSSLSTALQSLTDFEGVLAEKEGSSSDNSVVELTGASPAASAGTHSIIVSQLAQAFSYASSAVNSGDTLSGTLKLGSQTITLSDGTAKDGSGKTIPRNNTLSTLASYINSGDYGVEANVVSLGNGQSELTLVSTTSGALGSVAVDTSQFTDATAGSTTAGAVTFSQQQKGQDAEFSLDGLPAMTSSSNTVTTAIQGVTMQLLSAAPKETVQLEITNNNSDVETAVSNFVNAYNKVVGDLNTQEGNDSSGNPEPLYGNPSLALLQEQLQEALNFTQSSGGVTSLSQLGITAGARDDGTLTLDTGALDSRLNSNYQDVVGFFQPSASFTSFGGNLTNILNSLGNSGPDGAVYLALQQDSSQEKALNQNVSNQETLISSEKTQLTTELNQANYTLEAIPRQIDEVNELYSAITGYNQNLNG